MKSKCILCLSFGNYEDIRDPQTDLHFDLKEI